MLPARRAGKQLRVGQKNQMASGTLLARNLLRHRVNRLLGLWLRHTRIHQLVGDHLQRHSGRTITIHTAQQLLPGRLLQHRCLVLALALLTLNIAAKLTYWECRNKKQCEITGNLEQTVIPLPIAVGAKKAPCPASLVRPLVPKIKIMRFPFVAVRHRLTILIQQYTYTANLCVFIWQPLCMCQMGGKFKKSTVSTGSKNPLSDLVTCIWPPVSIKWLSPNCVITNRLL